MFGLTTTRRHRVELAATRAETNRQRARAEAALKDKGTAEFNREQVLAQKAELHAANTRLAGRNKALGERLLAADVAAGFNPVQAKLTAERIARLARAVAKARREAAEARSSSAADAERKRADALQQRLDHAVGLDHPELDLGKEWQERRTDKPQPARGATS